MPAQVIPYIIGIIALFSAFIIAVGSAALYTALPRKHDSRS
tara:strand:- start:29 stop:151 length:123 start_codon:yes stop_codon:yes gene_type:complete